MKIYLLCVLASISCSINAYAQPDPTTEAFMTARDVKDSTLSGVTITNHAGESVPVAGLSISSVDDTTNDCSHCYGNIVGGDNIGGVVVSPVTVQNGQVIAIGQNYLYNMLYNGMSYIKNIVGRPPCSLPGCSWHEDDPNMKGWCITINAISRTSSYTYNPTYTNGSYPPANTPSYGAAGFSPSGQYNYNYDLINPATLGSGAACIGPITCDDKTLTCQVSTPQDESFEPWIPPSLSARGNKPPEPSSD